MERDEGERSREDARPWETEKEHALEDEELRPGAGRSRGKGGRRHGKGQKEGRAWEHQGARMPERATGGEDEDGDQIFPCYI
uniref:Uncharacterized protein n=1 Tax=Zea mays TaxID=4577 RepID=A0A804LR48_MAIZE